MKVGHLEFNPAKAAVAAAVWIACWSAPLMVRPVVLKTGKLQEAHVRGLKKQFGGMRCRIIAATALGEKPVRFYAYGAPELCDKLTHGSPVKLVLRKLGPIYWVQLADDGGFGDFQRLVAIACGLVLTCLLLYLYWRWTIPKVKSANAIDLREMIRHL